MKHEEQPHYNIVYGKESNLDSADFKNKEWSTHRSTNGPTNGSTQSCTECTADDDDDDDGNGDGDDDDNDNYD